MRRARRRGVTPIISQILMVGLMVALGATLWAFRPNLPTQPSALYYQVVTGPGEPTWGDGSDCSTVNGFQTCLVLPSHQIILTGSTPSPLRISNLVFYFLCNGTVYLTAPLAALEWVPGTTGTPSGSAPQLGTCGSFIPPAAAFNRLMYFHQLIPGAATVTAGDYLVIYSPFQPPNCPAPKFDKNGTLIACDDDFHGIPHWCFVNPGACSIILASQGPPVSSLAKINLYGLSP